MGKHLIRNCLGWHSPLATLATGARHEQGFQGIPAERLELLRESAVLHDIGKLGVEERILNKVEPLTDAEWAAVRKHPVIAEDILAPILLNKELLAVIRGHHERYDGAGYPDGLKGSSIRLFAQILSVADSYDAMTSLRSYRPAFKHEKAMEELIRHRNSQFSGEIVDAFITVMNERASGGGSRV